MCTYIEPFRLYIYSALVVPLHSLHFFNFSGIFFRVCIHLCVCVYFVLFSWMFPLFVGTSHSFFHWPISFSSLILYLPRNHFVYNWNVYVFLAFNDGQTVHCARREKKRQNTTANSILFSFVVPLGVARLVRTFGRNSSKTISCSAIKKNIKKCQHLLLKNMKSIVEIKTRTMINISIVLCTLVIRSSFFSISLFFRFFSFCIPLSQSMFHSKRLNPKGKLPDKRYHRMTIRIPVEKWEWTFPQKRRSTRKKNKSTRNVKLSRSSLRWDRETTALRHKQINKQTNPNDETFNDGSLM